MKPFEIFGLDEETDSDDSESTHLTFDDDLKSVQGSYLNLHLDRRHDL